MFTAAYGPGHFDLGHKCTKTHHKPPSVLA